MRREGATAFPTLFVVIEGEVLACFPAALLCCLCMVIKYLIALSFRKSS